VPVGPFDAPEAARVAAAAQPGLGASDMMDVPSIAARLLARAGSGQPC
jgi:hypothetical protein